MKTYLSQLFATASIAYTILVQAPVDAQNWFYIGGNRSTSNVNTALQGIYTEIDTNSIREAKIDGGKGIYFRIRVGAIFKDGRSGIASHDNDELIRDCTRNKTWYIKKKMWSTNWQELGDYLCDLSTRNGSTWGTEVFRVKSE